MARQPFFNSARTLKEPSCVSIAIACISFKQALIVTKLAQPHKSNLIFKQVQRPYRILFDVRKITPEQTFCVVFERKVSDQMFVELE